MKYPIIIKRGPLALIKNIIIAEFAVAAFLLVIGAFTSYQSFYSQSVFSKIIRYNYSLIISASLLQFVTTLLVFFRWHNSRYEIRKQEIISTNGLFSTRQDSFPLKNAKSIDYTQGPLEKIMNCGTIVIHDLTSERPFYLRNIEDVQILADIIKNLTDKATNGAIQKAKRLSVLDLILGGESHYLELKQTFRWDVKQKTVNKALEKTVMRTIAGFLNSDGGKLIIGASDDKSVFGLENDYKTLLWRNKDGFERHFNQVFNKLIGPRFRRFIALSFETIDNKDVCLVEVAPGDEPVYLNLNNSEEFFIRIGNATAPLAMSKALNYIKSRWK